MATEKEFSLMIEEACNRQANFNDRRLIYKAAYESVKADNEKHKLVSFGGEGAIKEHLIDNLQFNAKRHLQEIVFPNLTRCPKEFKADKLADNSYGVRVFKYGLELCIPKEIVVERNILIIPAINSKCSDYGMAADYPYIPLSKSVIDWGYSNSHNLLIFETSTTPVYKNGEWVYVSQ